MARSDLLLKLLEAGSKGDRPTFRRVAEALIAEERGQRHDLLADRLEAKLQEGEVQPRLALREAPADNLVYARSPERHLSDLYLPDDVRSVIDEVIEEQRRVSLLHALNLEPRHRLLLIGPPGNGKTSLAEALAYELALPLFVVRYERVIASYLGETALRISQLFDFVRARQCVLLFDEFDTVAKERGDPHDTGEIKRVVSSLVLGVDDLPSHVLMVTATNHPELLDRAVWRRFQVRLQLPPPTVAQRRAYLTGHLSDQEGLTASELQRLAGQLSGLSFAELEEFVFDVKRRAALSGPDVRVASLLTTRLRQWRARKAASSLNNGAI